MQDVLERSSETPAMGFVRKTSIGLAAVTWLVAASPVFAGPDYDGAALAFPSGCAGRTVERGDGLNCTLSFVEGTLSIDLVFNSFSIASFSRYIGKNQDEFLKNPQGYMRSALRKFEEIAVRQRDSGRGDVKIIKQNTRAVAAKRTQTGLEQCLYFLEDAHVSEKSGTYLGRVDISGLRCLGHDPSIDRVWYAYVEVGAVHAGGVNERLPEFDKISRQIVDSLKLR